MDEETPVYATCIYQYDVSVFLQDVFKVSVGNLPPGASFLIKITYVAELLVEGENIVFNLPGSAPPWKKDTALDTTQACVAYNVYCQCSDVHIMTLKVYTCDQL